VAITGLLDKLALIDGLIERHEATNGHLARLLQIYSQACSRLGRLLRDRRAVSGEAADGIAGAVATVLDELGSELLPEIEASSRASGDCARRWDAEPEPARMRRHRLAPSNEPPRHQRRVTPNARAPLYARAPKTPSRTTTTGAGGWRNGSIGWRSASTGSWPWPPALWRRR
jgi:hypothetical protein